MTGQNTRPTPSSDVEEELRKALTETLAFAEALEKHRSKGTGGRRGGPIFSRARRALSRLSPPAHVEVTDEMVLRALEAYWNDKPDRRIAMRAALTAALTATDAKPVSHEHIEVTDAGLQGFAEWFRKNYPGPDTIIHKPDWHSPKIYRAAIHHARCTDAKPVVPAEPVAEFRTDAVDYIDSLNVLCEDFGCEPGSDRLHWLHERLSRAEMADEALRAALAVHGDQYSWGAQARAALARAKGRHP